MNEVNPFSRCVYTVCVHARSDGGSVGGFPHKCQLVAKGISISHRRTGGVLLDAWVSDSHLQHFSEFGAYENP